jgi:hypothetical protein
MENITLEDVTLKIKEAGDAFTQKAKDAETLAQKAVDLSNELKEKGATKEEIAEMQKHLDALEAKMKHTDFGGKQKAKDLVAELSEKKADIQKLVKSNSGSIELKANTVLASIEDNDVSFHLPNIGQLGVKNTTLFDVLPKINVPAGMHNGKISYIDWDEDTTVRAASALAEAEPFNESTAKFKYYTEELKKIGDILPVSEEFGEDATTAAAELSRFLQVNVAQERSRQLVEGDGTSNTFKGLLNRAIAYTPVGAGIVDANLKDLVRKMRTSIVKNRGSKYQPDIVVMNSDTYDQYYLKKDGENNYLFDENGRIAGLTVVEDNFMPDNTLVVGDRRFAAIYQMMGIILSEGYVGDQFGEDLKSIKARTRLLMLIREVDRTGFLKCTDIADALETLEDPAST